MKPLIRRVESPTEEEWDVMWSDCEYATYFHSREWAEIWNRYTRSNISHIVPSPQLIYFSDHKKAILPQSRRCIMRRFLPKLLSTPAGCYGGWISNDDLSKGHADTIVSYLKTRQEPCSIRLNPYDELVQQMNLGHGNECYTWTISLLHTLGELERRAKSSHRRAVRKARSYNLEVCIADSFSDWSQYYELYKKTVLRWGRAAGMVYALKLFEILHNLESPYIRLWVAKKRGRVVSGVLCFYSRQCVSYWHGATDTECFKLRPVNLLFDEVIRDAKTRGFEWLDLGASGINEGVRRFKESLGAQVIAYPAIERSSLPEKILGSLKAA